MLATMLPAARLFAATGLVALSLAAGCALPASPSAAPRYLLYGEQHDQDDQQRQVADDVRALAARGALAALVVEMAERGRSTASLPRDADAAQLREALAWDERGWPWARYGPVVTAAHGAGVPVLGGNLPRSAMRDAMSDAALDAALDAATRERLAQAVRDGHCNLLPESQLPGMLRVQVARDRAIASTLLEAALAAPPGRHVVLLAGAQHVARDVGVPLHLRSAGVDPRAVRAIAFGPDAPGVAFDERRSAVVTPQPDHCAELKRQLDARPRR